MHIARQFHWHFVFQIDKTTWIYSQTFVLHCDMMFVCAFCIGKMNVFQSLMKSLCFDNFYMWSVHVICSGDLYFKSYEIVIMGGKTRFPGSQSSFRNFKSIVKMVLLSICLSPSIFGNIILGSWYHGSMDHIIKVCYLMATGTYP